MEILIHQAILHVLDTTLDAPVLSGSCMELTAENSLSAKPYRKTVCQRDPALPSAGRIRFPQRAGA